jgi:hypothetical protein
MDGSCLVLSTNCTVRRHVELQNTPEILGLQSARGNWDDRRLEEPGSAYNAQMKILYLHGWKSAPGGTKPVFLAEGGHEVLNPALPEDFDQAVRVAQAEWDRHKPDVVVGSSWGGAVAMNICRGDASLVLLAPAWKEYGSATTVNPDTIILHARADEEVPIADSEELLRNSGLNRSGLVEVGTEHRLADRQSLLAMLKACEMAANKRMVGPGTAQRRGHD